MDETAMKNNERTLRAASLSREAMTRDGSRNVVDQRKGYAEGKRGKE